MYSGPGKLVGEDCRVREVCDKTTNGVTGSMNMDAVNIGGGAILATTRGATARMDLDGEHGGDSLELAMGGWRGCPQ